MAFFHDSSDDDDDGKYGSCPECGAETPQSDLIMAGMCESCAIKSWEDESNDPDNLDNYDW